MRRKKYFLHYTVYAESTDGIVLAVGETNYRKALKKLEGIKRSRKHARLEGYLVRKVIYEARHISEYYDRGYILSDLGVVAK